MDDCRSGILEYGKGKAKHTTPFGSNESGRFMGNTEILLQQDHLKQDLLISKHRNSIHSPQVQLLLCWRLLWGGSAKLPSSLGTAGGSELVIVGCRKLGTQPTPRRSSCRSDVLRQAFRLGTSLTSSAQLRANTVSHCREHHLRVLQ